MYFVRKYWNVINGFEILIKVKCDSCGKGIKKMCKKNGSCFRKYYVYILIY